MTSWPTISANQVGRGRRGPHQRASRVRLRTSSGTSVSCLGAQRRTSGCPPQPVLDAWPHSSSSVVTSAVPGRWDSRGPREARGTPRMPGRPGQRPNKEDNDDTMSCRNRHTRDRVLLLSSPIPTGDSSRGVNGERGRALADNAQWPRPIPGSRANLDIPARIKPDPSVSFLPLARHLSGKARRSAPKVLWLDRPTLAYCNLSRITTPADLAP